MNRAEQIAELEAAVEELVTVVEDTARTQRQIDAIRTLAGIPVDLEPMDWSPDLHDNTVDTAIVEAAADHLKEQLGE